MKHIFFLFLFLFSCSNHTIIPKPKAFFYNELSVPSYVNYITNCGYSFFINSNNEIDLENCNMKIKNSSLNSTLYLMVGSLLLITILMEKIMGNMQL